jgi:hypothetical protein
MAVADDVVKIASSGLTTSTTPYVAGDVLGTVFTVTGAASAAGGHGAIRGLLLGDKADIIGPVDAYIFDTSPSVTDNAAFAPSDAEMLTLLGKIELGQAEDLGANRFAWWRGYEEYECGGATTSLFIVLVTRTGHTFFGAAGDLQLTVKFTKTD